MIHFIISCVSCVFRISIFTLCRRSLGTAAGLHRRLLDPHVGASGGSVISGSNSGDHSTNPAHNNSVVHSSVASSSKHNVALASSGGPVPASTAHTTTPPATSDANPGPNEVLVALEAKLRASGGGNSGAGQQPQPKQHTLTSPMMPKTTTLTKSSPGGGGVATAAAAAASASVAGSFGQHRRPYILIIYCSIASLTCMIFMTHVNFTVMSLTQSLTPNPFP